MMHLAVLFSVVQPEQLLLLPPAPLPYTMPVPEVPSWPSGRCLHNGLQLINSDCFLVLMHDSNIDRTTTGKGKVEDLTLAELKTFRLRSPYGRISEESIPTFEAALKIIKGKITNPPPPAAAP